MSLTPELQRILARGPESLPDLLVADAGAIARWAFEVDPRADVWPALIGAARRTHRRIAWVVAETALPCVGVDAPALDRIQHTLENSLGPADVLRASEPVPALLAALAATQRTRVAVLSAGLEERPHELWLLDDGQVAAMLDIATGRLWTHTSASDFHGDPHVLPYLHAILGPGTDAPPVIREAKHYVPQLLEAARIGLPFAQADIPLRVRNALAEKEPAIDALAAALRGDGRPDGTARVWLRSWLDAPARSAPIERSDTAYILAEVDRSTSPLTLKRVSVRVGAREDAAQDHAGALALLRSVIEDGPKRWFVPHVLDVLGVMADHGVALPPTVMDPAYMAFALDPDAPPSVSEHCGAALSLSAAARRWLDDSDRELPFPQRPRNWDALCGILPILDRDLNVALQHHGLQELLEADIGQTLPILAKIERRGAWVDVPAGYSDWEQVQRDLDHELDSLHQVFMPVFGAIDPFRADYRELVPLLKEADGFLPAEFWSPDLSAHDEFDRYVVLGSSAAAALARARSIESSSFYWLPLLQSSGGRLRGTHVPATTGRMSMRELPLHGLPKKTKDGVVFRSSLRAPDGYELLGADFNAFEARLLASLSGDPVLVGATRALDMHAAVAQRLFGTSATGYREAAKIGVYSIIYGQSERGFRRRQASWPHAFSSQVYQAIKSTLSVALNYRDGELRQFKTSGQILTRGGWRRSPEKPRDAFNTLIQGLGADILRRVLRELDRQLSALDAFIVHQAHDEVIVATRPDCADHAARILELTMKNAATQPPSLLPLAIPLDVKIRRGTRWSDLL